MKTFSKTSLPDSISHNGKMYVRVETPKFKPNGQQIEPLPSENPICVKVLNKNLRGRLDIHNQPYQPTIHYFVPKKEENPV